MTAGTGLIMWMGELITERGIGNGMSLLIFTSIAASFPQSLVAIAAAQELRGSCVVIVDRRRDRRGRRVRRAVAAAHPRAVREADGRPSNLRRQQHVHPDQGQHGRRRAGHLRVVAAVPARADRAVQPAATAARRRSRGSPWITELPHRAATTRCTCCCTSCSSSDSPTSTSRSPSTLKRSPTT